MQQNLPYNPMQQTAGFLQINLNMPPHVPPIPVDPYVQQYVPMISAATAMSIQERAHVNPLRMFMFNMMARNGYINPDFEVAVGNVVDYILLLMGKRAVQTVEQAIQMAVPKVVDLICANNVRTFPGLQAYVTPDIVQLVQNTVYEFDQVSNEIQFMRQQRPNMMGNMQQNQMTMQQVNMNMMPPPTRPMGGSASMFSSSPTPVQAGSTFGMTPAQSTGKTFGGSRFDNQPLPGNMMSQPFQGRTEPLQPPVQMEPAPSMFAAQPEKQILRASETTWKRSDENPYPPVYDPTRYDLLYRIEGNKQFPILDKKGTPVMDFDRHNLISSFGPIPKAITLEPTGDTVARITAAANKNAEEVLDETEAPTVTLMKGLLCETSLDAAWFVASVERIKRNGSQKQGIFRVYAQVAQPLVSCKDETAVIKEFSESRTFVELREKMNAMVADISPDLWFAVNRRMTEVVNRTLAQNMSLPTASIEVFTDDILDIIGILEKKYGMAIRNAFLKYQKEQISAALQMFTEDVAGPLTEMYLGDMKDCQEECLPKILFLASTYSLTLLDVAAHELNLELIPKQGCAVTEQYTPLMFSLLHTLFADVNLREENFHRHLLKTTDGQILEATQGNLGEGFYLLTLL